MFFSNLKQLLMFRRILTGFSSLNMTVKYVIFLKIMPYSKNVCHVNTNNDILAKNMSYKSKNISYKSKNIWGAECGHMGH